MGRWGTAPACLAGLTCGECELAAAARRICARGRNSRASMSTAVLHEAIADARFAVALPEHYSRAGRSFAVRRTDPAGESLRGGPPRRAWACTGSAPRRTSSRSSAHARAPGVIRFRGGRAMPRRRISPARLGAVWAAASDERPPQSLDAAIIFDAGGRPWCRRHCARWRPGGTVICAGIHMSDIPGPFSLPDPLGERYCDRWRT